MSATITSQTHHHHHHGHHPRHHHHHHHHHYHPLNPMAYDGSISISALLWFRSFLPSPAYPWLDWILSQHCHPPHHNHHSVVLLFKLIVMHNCLIVVAIWFPREVSIRSLTPVEGVGDCSIWFGGFGQVWLVRFGLVWLCQVCFGLVWSGKLQGRWCIVPGRWLVRVGCKLRPTQCWKGASGGRAGSGRLIVVAGSLF